MQRRGRLRRLVSRSGADAILLSAPKESVSARKPIFTAAGHRPVSPARSLEPLSELDVAVPPKGDSYTHRHEQSERLVVAPPARIDCYDEGPGGGRTETVTQAEVNRFTR